MVKIEHLNKKFGKLEVLKDLDLTIKKGTINAILGPNGSGKTTLIKCMLGMVIPDSGTISIADKTIKGDWKYRDEIDYMPQIANFPPNLKVREIIAMLKDIRNRDARDAELIEYFELAPYLNKQLRNLSGGTMQKVNIVLAFMFDNPLLILDEPTNGLDPVALLRLKELIAREVKSGKTILFTTHIIRLVEELAEDIVFLLEGKIYFQGSVKEMVSQQKAPDLEHAIADIFKNNPIIETA
ncbi:MAG: ABC transporter ATP-binding protein [Bacteroidetes bacterium]|nr:MAG: ABC transporter ATP-binding protein [Bacteroidota bacterium]